MKQRIVLVTPRAMQALLRDSVGKLLWVFSSCRNAYFGCVCSIAKMPEVRNMSNYGLICSSFIAGTAKVPRTLPFRPEAMLGPV